MQIGVLGAARIAPPALIKPAKENSDVVVAAVAARDVSRAQAFAAKHGIARVHDSYEALLADPDIDAVYNPLPNGLHGKWTRAALAAGKHVLCEKPFTANADEAREIAEVAAQSDRVVMEAFHYRYHPVALRMAEIVASGELGRLQVVEANFAFPLPKFDDIRYSYPLAGGALMDAGCYALDCLRFLGGERPEVVRARAKRAARALVGRRAHPRAGSAAPESVRSPGGARWCRSPLPRRWCGRLPGRARCVPPLPAAARADRRRSSRAIGGPRGWRR